MVKWHSFVFVPHSKVPPAPPNAHLGAFPFLHPYFWQLSIFIPLFPTHPRSPIRAHFIILLPSVSSHYPPFFFFPDTLPSFFPPLFFPLSLPKIFSPRVNNFLISLPFPILFCVPVMLILLFPKNLTRAIKELRNQRIQEFCRQNRSQF